MARFRFAAFFVGDCKSERRNSVAGIDRGNNALDQNVESERNIVLGYVVQSGPLKDVGFEWRRIDVKTRYGNGSASGADYQENRLITTYTWKF